MPRLLRPTLPALSLRSSIFRTPYTSTWLFMEEENRPDAPISIFPAPTKHWKYTQKACSTTAVLRNRLFFWRNHTGRCRRDCHFLAHTQPERYRSTSTRHPATTGLSQFRGDVSGYPSRITAHGTLQSQPGQINANLTMHTDTLTQQKVIPEKFSTIILSFGKLLAKKNWVKPL